jgi:isoleucyl-tRNA synthetase
VLLNNEPFEHSYPHCWRHKTPTAFRVTPQWFISMNKANLRADAMAAIGGINWTPSWGEDRIRGMVESRPDWCISRQRTWGVPITLFTDRNDNSLHPDTVRLMHAAADLAEQQGVDCWYHDDIYDQLGVDRERYQRVKDILDVWFDSGVSHYCVLDDSIAINGESPYRQVLTHGFTVDADGKKMSKSLGNVIAPQHVMKTLGADVLRLWVASADYRNEMSVSDEILRRVSDTYRRIRNTARFLLGNLHDFEPESCLDAQQLLPLDRWAVDCAHRFQGQLEQAYEEYNFMQVYQQVRHFCGVEMGAFYLDILKDRLYTTGRESHSRRSAQTAMFHVLEALVRWIAPILSFTVEELWKRMPGEREESVLMETWYDGLFEFDQPDVERARWKNVIAVRDAVSKSIEQLRASGEAGSSLEVNAEVWTEGPLLQAMEWIDDELRFVLLTSGAKSGPLADAPGDAQRISLEGGELAVRVTPAKGEKCVRCWHRREDVGQHPEHPEICGRCVTNVDGPGEQRRIG